MIKNSLKIFGVLFILLFQFTSCLDNDDRKLVYYFYDEPVVVNQMGEYPFVRNQSVLFYVPGLVNNMSLKEGDLLWASFIVDSDNQEQPDLSSNIKSYTARSFQYKTIDSTKVIIPADAAEFESYLSDDYSAPIESSVLYGYNIDSLWFFGFMQRDRPNQLSYAYELILNPEIESGNYPTLYIRSKQVNASTEYQAKDRLNRRVFAFDVADFVNYYREKISSTDVIQFNLKYKIGTDSNGKDIYKEFMSNPISWDFNNKPK